MEPLRKTASLLWRYILEEKFKSKVYDSVYNILFFKVCVHMYNKLIDT